MINAEFIKAISDCFEEIIKDSQFNLISIPCRIGHEVQLVSNKCIVRFMYGIDGLTCAFINPLEKSEREKVVRKDGLPTGYPVYSVHLVWKYLYPKDKEGFDYNSMGKSLAESLDILKRLLLTRLINVVQGDFSWKAIYYKQLHEVNYKIRYMREHWAMDNPVRLKFKRGDLSWEKDFDDYKAFLDNLSK